MEIKEACKICQSFGLKLANPQNQYEFDNLESILSYKEKWGFFGIAGYRSETNKWKDCDDNLKYSIEKFRGFSMILVKMKTAFVLKKV